jgi:hypothetical protein
MTMIAAIWIMLCVFPLTITSVSAALEATVLADAREQMLAVLGRVIAQKNPNCSASVVEVDLTVQILRAPRHGIEKQILAHQVGARRDHGECCVAAMQRPVHLLQEVDDGKGLADGRIELDEALQVVDGLQRAGIVKRAFTRRFDQEDQGAGPAEGLAQQVIGDPDGVVP